MTVRELIKQLKQCSPNDLVVMASDSEGNSYDTLGAISNQYNFNETNAEIGLREIKEEDKGLYGEEDVMQGVPCVVLWP